jgi:hypothetical protein
MSWAERQDSISIAAHSPESSQNPLPGDTGQKGFKENLLKSTQ